MRVPAGRVFRPGRKNTSEHVGIILQVVREICNASQRRARVTVSGFFVYVLNSNLYI